jgi:nitrate/nitrite-specific signal transduction histidine kinase
MRERAMIIGASLSIDSSPGNGTTVSLTVPRSSREATQHSYGDGQTTRAVST